MKPILFHSTARLARLLTLACALTLAGQVAALAAETPFRAGHARVEITPEKPLPMWGYGERRDAMAVGARDPLFADCVVIEAGAERLAIVGLDLGRSPGDPMFSRILESVRASVGVGQILMSGSHTHHAPVLELKDAESQGRGKYNDALAYYAALEAKLAKVIEAAAADLRDARLGWGSAELEMNRNRHRKQEPKSRDRELAVLRLDDLGGKPIALIVNFAAHPVMLSAGDLRWSADYPGPLKRVLSAELGAPVVFMQGAAGDLSPQSAPEHSMADNDPALANPSLNPGQAASLERVKSLRKPKESELLALKRDYVKADFRMEAFGAALGREAAAVAKSIQSTRPARPEIKGRRDLFAFESRVDFKNPFLISLFATAFFPELANSCAADHADNLVRPSLTTILLNQEVAFVGGSGEFFCDHSLRLKERSRGVKTLFFGYCNGHNMYLPTIEAAAEGGYGADAQMSWVALGAGEEMMNQALIHLFEMRGKLTTRRVP